MSGTETALDFDALLAALMERLGTRVRISVCAAQQPRPSAQVLDMEGTITAGWDPEVLRENGFEDGAIFRIEEADGFSLYLLREDFQEAELHGDRVLIRTGGVAVVVQPPFENSSPA